MTVIHHQAGIFSINDSVIRPEDHSRELRRLFTTHPYNADLGSRLARRTPTRRGTADCFDSRDPLRYSCPGSVPNAPPSRGHNPHSKGMDSNTHTSWLILHDTLPDILPLRCKVRCCQ